MEVIKVIALFILGIGAAITGFLGIKKQTDRPWLVVLSSLIMALGVIGFALFSKALFLILVALGIILIFLVG